MLWVASCGRAHHRCRTAHNANGDGALQPALPNARLRTAWVSLHSQPYRFYRTMAGSKSLIPPTRSLTAPAARANRLGFVMAAAAKLINAHIRHTNQGQHGAAGTFSFVPCIMHRPSGRLRANQGHRTFCLSRHYAPGAPRPLGPASRPPRVGVRASAREERGRGHMQGVAPQQCQR